MNEETRMRNALLAQKVIKGINSRNMTGYFAETKEEALRKALEMIPEKSTIHMGGCQSAVEIGLADALQKGDYNFVVQISKDLEERRKMCLDGYDADIYLASANAMTDDGVIVNIDGFSNRVSSIAYGPKKVIFIVGMNKVCTDIDSAMKRARNVAAPINAGRLGRGTPCAKTGTCINCKSPDTICCNFLITRYSRHKDRIFVILVNEDLGY